MEKPTNNESAEKAAAVCPVSGTGRHPQHTPKRERQPKPFVPGKDAPTIISQGEAAAILRRTTKIKDADGNKVTFDSQLLRHFQKNGRWPELKFLQYAMQTASGKGMRHRNRDGIIRTFYACEFDGAGENGETLNMLVVVKTNSKGHVKTFFPCKTSERMWRRYDGKESCDE